MSVRVLLSDPAFDGEGSDVEFRLTYEGPLYAERRSDRHVRVRATHKHAIRKRFHRQLKQLWAVAPQLVDENIDGGAFLITEGEQFPHTVPDLANRFAQNGYRFVPLVTKSIDVGCSIDVLFLRTDAPGSIISAGDIDNRLKTIFDALTMPRDAKQLGDYTTPDDGEDPFFCLLEDDRLMTRASVDTDRLLEPTSANADASDARLVITVRLTPLNVTPFNLRFA